MTTRASILLLLMLTACAPQEEEGTPTTPGPGGDRVDDAALLEAVQVLSADSLQGRRVGTPGNAMARALIRDAFTDAGLHAFDGGYQRAFPIIRDTDTLTGTNVIGYMTGREFPDRYIVLSAHYDHLGVRDGEIYNGADDNASGTAALMVLGEYLAANPLRHGVILAAFDAEEGGLRGARAFVADPPVPLEQIVLNVNLDMISHSDSVIFAAGSHHYPFIREWLAGVEEPGVVLRFGHDRPELGNDDWTGASDHGPFHEAGIPFIYFGVEDHPDYHRPTDDFERINQTFYPAAVELILDALLAADTHLEPEGEAPGGP